MGNYMWTSRINQVQVPFWKQGKYKRPLLIRQENHSLKMLTMTFQKSWFLSNRQEHVKEGKKKFSEVLKRRNKVSNICYTWELHLARLLQFTFPRQGHLCRGNMRPALVRHHAGNLWLWQMPPDWRPRPSHFKPLNILKTESLKFKFTYKIPEGTEPFMPSSAFPLAL